MVTARGRLKHRWSVTHNYLAGITARSWWQLLRDNQFRIDPAYSHRAAFITLTSLMNSRDKAKEDRQFSAALEKVRICHPPLFILGHWRSGTTLLQYLLAQDTEQFAFPNTYQVVNPQTFLSAEDRNKRRFARLVPSKRPMDNMALSFDTPQEDEFAPCLTSLRSPYLGISFPRRENHYLRYLTFDSVPEAEVEQWRRAFVSFLLKSPPHTARIRILLTLFPGARFIHVHRDPLRVFQSTQHYFDTAMWYTYLQRPDPERLEAGILHRYNLVYDAFFRDQKQIPASHFCEVAFEDLERDPVGQVRFVYERLNLPGFAAFQAKLKRYVASLEGYQKNQFSDLKDGERRRISRLWQRSFDEWKYPS
jgi:omega-hydroxy-beta-dihydromenaquinone-9 sulfotransferase